MLLFRHKQVLPRYYIYRATRRQRFAMSIPTFDEMRRRMLPIWQEADYARDILWAGIFGSVARNRAHTTSDVDILVVLKEHERSGEPLDLRENLAEACGREISLMLIWQGPDWAWGHVRLEALLSSRTVYGNRQDVEHLRLEAVSFLEEGLKKLDHISEAVENIKKTVAAVQTYENFVEPIQAHARETCCRDLRTILQLLDIQPLHHPIRTMILVTAFEYADKIRILLDQNQLNLATDAAPFWREVWDLLQPSSMSMWAFDSGCVMGTRAYIRHMLASKSLADRFEDGGQVDDSMYKEILR
ncbi:hypothetical protein AN958_07174 [Leucoagaricus sp. SymC.cos]|nr:hypothetical protein AN958_12386 [Leucoagaricus sp. SymC.cos]KXN88538.1 hypothetical protein AN958_07174 [Leucoagaricus sp. SymC.cos]